MTVLHMPHEFSPRIVYGEPMTRHTSWHVGGPADIWFTPRDAADLASFLRQLPRAVPVTLVGLGSNLLVRDAGIRGAVICLHFAFSSLERLDERRVRAEAGVPCARVARNCTKWGLGPAEFFAGIPGTVGGALAMNAGAWGGETWPHVVEVEVIDRGGECRRRAATEYRYAYRAVMPPAPDEWFLAATLEFELRPAATTGAIKQLLERRRDSQPIGEWSCGSVFVNPPGDHAARLIETAGLKGFCIGDAMVSNKHANFIVNRGRARAADLETLIEHVRATVERVHGVRLHTEVRAVGEAA